MPNRSESDCSSQNSIILKNFEKRLEQMQNPGAVFFFFFFFSLYIFSVSLFLCLIFFPSSSLSFFLSPLFESHRRETLQGEEKKAKNESQIADELRILELEEKLRKKKNDRKERNKLIREEEQQKRLQQQFLRANAAARGSSLINVIRVFSRSCSISERGSILEIHLSHVVSTRVDPVRRKNS